MRNKRGFSDESGAALIAVIFISILLVTACAMLLTAVGHNSRNSTDVLAETKAYYAAESGLQATINVFRNNQDVDFKNNPYSYAVGDPDLDTKLTGYTTINGIRQIPVGTNSGYSVNITDPDNSGVSITFSVDGEFLQADGYSWASTRVFGTGLNTTTISYAGASSQTLAHPINNANFGNFQIVKAGSGGTLSDLRFRINYRMTAPRSAVKQFTGKIIGSTRVATIDAGQDYVGDGNTSDTDYVFSLMGKFNIFLCANNTVPCATDNQFSMTLPTPTTTIQPSTPTLYAKLLPIEPYRLKLQITGYARPGNSKKQLEAVIQRNFFNDMSPGAAVSMIGPNADMQGGNSNNFQITGGSVPSISVSDSTGLANVMDDPRYSNYQPPPVIANPSDLPDWQQSPQAMDALVTQLRQTAINSGTYFASGQQPSSWGNANGTGITFCDGSCELTASKQNPGGGILVVTGTLTVSGNSGFNGLMLITGPGGLVLSGGGSSQWNGSVVIAPYDTSTMQWQTPHYVVNGGALATDFDTLLVDNSFDAVNGVTDFILGIAEK